MADDDVKKADAPPAAGEADAPPAAGEGDDAPAAGDGGESPPAAGEADRAPGGKAGDDASAAGGADAVYDVPVEVTAVLGTASMKVSQLLKLGRGAVVQLDRMVGESIELHANNRLIARGEVVVIDDRLGVTMTEIIKSDRS